MVSGFSFFFAGLQDWNMRSRIYPQWRERINCLEGTIVIHVMEIDTWRQKARSVGFFNIRLCAMILSFFPLSGRFLHCMGGMTRIELALHDFQEKKCAHVWQETMALVRVPSVFGTSTRHSYQSVSGHARRLFRGGGLAARTIRPWQNSCGLSSSCYLGTSPRD